MVLILVCAMVKAMVVREINHESDKNMGKNLSFVQKVVLWNDNHESGGEGGDQIPHHGRYL